MLQALSLFVTLLLSPLNPPAPQDAKVVDLKDGFVRVESKDYTVEVPKDWKISDETPWGQRKAQGSGRAELGVMTGSAAGSTWERLYETSLFFIQREERGTPTPYKIEKTDQGLDAMTFSVKDRNGFASRRYVVIMNSDRRILALSVRIPTQAEEKKLDAYFQRMVKSARFL
ncbi:MAG TPA: hypothetical protein PLO61_08420 [Fimbriimonadaceae bacterium]|nr:hypothetical protein [Fimbriimonadaceae bacterium]HRJ33573.1 hypothetical protein [Fimbriimonadaceae bacterium]